MQREFTLRITLGNDAMNTTSDVARTLNVVARKLELGDETGIIKDFNGNIVGMFDGNFDPGEE